MDKEKNNILPVTFSNRDGSTLFGLIHEPLDNRRNDTGVILLSAGVKGRVAPHRLYIKMARLFADAGFTTLRFDFCGLGDSEGAIEEQYLADFYQSIELGRYTDDTIAAIDWMEDRFGFRRFILAGLCGGAIAGLHAGAKDHRVTSLIGIGLPVILAGAGIDRSKFLTKVESALSRRDYTKKLFSLSSWARFLSLRSDYKFILRSFLKPLVSKKTDQPNRAGQDMISDAEPSQLKDQTIKDNFNPYIPTLFKNFLTTGKILLFFGEADRYSWEFREKYMDRYCSELGRYQKNLEAHIVSQANHILSVSEWQKDMFGKLAAALESLDACG
jgi:pimeloyl-ACP methyl ester carboxylesterase